MTIICNLNKNGGSSRGVTAVDGAGFGVDRPAELKGNDDEYDAFRKRMMLAYRFRPNPLVTTIVSYFIFWCFSILKVFTKCLGLLFYLLDVFLFSPQNNPRRPYY